MVVVPKVAPDPPPARAGSASGAKISRNCNPDINQQTRPPTLPAGVCDVYGIVPPIRIPVPRLRVAGRAGQRIGGAERARTAVVVARQRIIQSALLVPGYCALRKLSVMPSAVS